MNSTIKNMMAYGAPAVISILLAGNIFFVRRFIDEFYSVRDVVWQLRQQVAVMEAKIDSRKR